MLDDLKLLHTRDTQDDLGHAMRQWRQLSYGLDDLDIQWLRDINNVVVFGDGDAGLAVMMARGWLAMSVPLEVISGSLLPSYVGPRTLCIVLADETSPEIVQAARQAQAMIVAVTDTLASDAGYLQLQYLEAPLSETEPRGWYGLKAVATILDACGLTSGKSTELANQQDWLRDELSNWGPQKATSHNQAKQMALELIGRSVVIYDDHTQLLSKKWKHDINKRAKQLAWTGDYISYNYAEVAGWTKQPTAKPYALLELRDPAAQTGKQSFYDSNDRLLSGLRPVPVVVELLGETVLQRLLYSSALSDSVSIYLAILNGVSPAPSPVIHALNKEIL
jgi:hypothetical protein